MNNHIENDLEQLLINDIIPKIVRHYKIIRKKFGRNDKHIVLNNHPNSDQNYNNIATVKKINVSNQYKNDKLSFLNEHEWNTLDDLQNYIKEADEIIHRKYEAEILNSDFDETTLNNIKNVLNKYFDNYKDHFYIRFAPYNEDDLNYDEWKQILIERVMSLINNDYFNDLKTFNEALYEELIENSDMPIYTDTIAYSNTQYDAIKQIEDKYNKEEINILNND